MSDVKLPSIPDDCTLEWVNGVLTLVKKDYNEQLSDHTFQVGEKAILARDTVFEQGMGLCCIAAGNKVEIISATHLFNNLYKIKFRNATTVIHGCDLRKPEDNAVEFKYSVKDRVEKRDERGVAYDVLKCYEVHGNPYYEIIKENDHADKSILQVSESEIVPYAEDITERIKTFEDAYNWCEEHDEENLVLAYNEIYERFNDMADMTDVFAYLKLRIIVTALNEGCVPVKDCWVAVLNEPDSNAAASYVSTLGQFGDSSRKLVFKTYKLAVYAGVQFKSIFDEFCGH